MVSEDISVCAGLATDHWPCIKERSLPRLEVVRLKAGVMVSGRCCNGTFAWRKGGGLLRPGLGYRNKHDGLRKKKVELSDCESGR